jgi:hypothetical protein
MKCEAPIHSPGCPCEGCRRPEKYCLSRCDVKLERQHEIPQCFRKVGVSKKEIQAHVIYEAHPCHVEEDLLIPQRFEEAKALKRQGVIFTAEKVLAMRKAGEFRKN